MEPEVEKKWLEDREYFKDIEQNLIDEGHKDEFALIYDHEVVSIGPDGSELAKTFYQEVGYLPFYCQQIGERRVYEVPSPELVDSF